MPTNSFENFYLSWTPDKRKIKRPYYLTLANALEEDIVSGKLAVGTKLPPQRELADYLDLNFTTITQAYNLCRERRLIYGVTGKGTFVSALPGNISFQKLSQNQDVIELGLLRGFDHIKTPIIEASKNVLTKGYIEELYSYAEVAGHLHQRAAGAHWMKQMDVNTDSEHTAIFSGAQNIISAAMLSLFKIGDKIAVDEFTYSNLIGTAHLSHIRLIPVKGDVDGMMPDELENLCVKETLNGIFLMPNCANPTTCTIPEKRKDELACVIARHRLILIEDDNTGIPQSGRSFSSMFSRLPEQTIYICNSTTALCNGLRVAFAAFPESFRVPLLNALYHLNIKTSSLDAEIMTELILSGKAARILEQKAELARERNKVFDRYFPEAVKPGTNAAFFRWLPLPKMAIDEMEIERQLLQDKKVNVYCSYRFSVARLPYSFMRIAISSPADTAQLETGCSIIRDFIKANQAVQV